MPPLSSALDPRLQERFQKRLQQRLSAEDIARFERDGAICIKQLLTPDEVALLREGIDANLAAPSPRAKVASRPDDPGRFFEDFCNWQDIPQFGRFVHETPLALAAKRLMQSRTVRLYHDHVLVKEPGTRQKTPWHQDQPEACGPHFAGSRWVGKRPSARRSPQKGYRPCEDGQRSDWPLSGPTLREGMPAHATPRCTPWLYRHTASGVRLDLHGRACLRDPRNGERRPPNIDGMQNISMWIPVDPVSRPATLEFVAGSHKGPWLMPRTFMDNQAKWFPEGSLQDMPDIEADRAAHPVLGWDITPGDVVCFHMLTLHGAGGFEGPGRRRVFSVRFMGEDTRHAPRRWTTSPEFPGLADTLPAGAPMDHPLFPLLVG